jgi:hypothetical protein
MRGIPLRSPSRACPAKLNPHRLHLFPRRFTYWNVHLFTGRVGLWATHAIIDTPWYFKPLALLGGAPNAESRFLSYLYKNG